MIRAEGNPDHDVASVPPHNTEAEQALIGAILAQGIAEYHGDSVNSGSTYELLDLARRWIPGSNVFYEGVHGRIWSGIIKLQEERKPIDVVLLRSRYRDEERNGVPTTNEVIDSLVDMRLSPAHAEHYAQMVYEVSEQRSLLDMLVDARSGLKTGGEDVVTTVNKLQRGLAAFGSVGGSMASVTSEVLCDEAPEHRDWAVEALFPTKTLTALVSDAKVGKTTLMFHLVKAMATGGSCIGLHCKEVKKILWACEETRDSIARNCRKVGLRSGKVEFVTREWLGRVPWQRAARALLDKAKAMEADLLIVDTFAAWAGLRGEEENQVGAVQSALLPLQQATNDGLTVVITHHQNKDPDSSGPNQIRGSSAFAGAVDGFLLLRREGGDESPLRAISGYGRGEGWAQSLRYVMDPDGMLRRGTAGRALAVRAVPAEGAGADPKARASVLGVLNDHEYLSQRAVERMIPRRRKTVRQAIAGLHAEGLIEVSGAEKPGQPAAIRLKANADPKPAKP